MTSFGAQVLACQQCGAPLQAPPSGHHVTCGYCRFTNQLRGPAAEPPVVDESARVAHLRAQDREGAPLPESVASFAAGGALDPDQALAAQETWTNLSRTVGANTFAEQERFFHLTLLLAPTLDPGSRRELLETAIGAVQDRNHQPVLRCLRAEEAIFDADLEAAASWLEPCEPRPSQLGADSSYRLAQSYLAAGRGDAAGITRQLGRSDGDVPIIDDRDGEAVVLRAHALELAGQIPQATEMLRQAMCGDVRRIHAIDQAVERSRRLRLCPAAYRDAHADVLRTLDVCLRKTEWTTLVIALIMFGVVLRASIGSDSRYSKRCSAALHCCACTSS